MTECAQLPSYAVKDDDGVGDQAGRDEVSGPEINDDGVGYRDSGSAIDERGDQEEQDEEAIQSESDDHLLQTHKRSNHEIDGISITQITLLKGAYHSTTADRGGTKRKVFAYFCSFDLFLMGSYA